MAQTCSRELFSVVSYTQEAAAACGSDGQASLGSISEKRSADDTARRHRIAIHAPLRHLPTPSSPTPCTRHTAALGRPSSYPALFLFCCDLQGSLTLTPSCPLQTPSILQGDSISVYGERPCILGGVQQYTSHTVEILTCVRSLAPCPSCLLGMLCKPAVLREPVLPRPDPGTEPGPPSDNYASVPLGCSGSCPHPSELLKA